MAELDTIYFDFTHTDGQKLSLKIRPYCYEPTAEPYFIVQLVKDKTGNYHTEAGEVEFFRVSVTVSAQIYMWSDGVLRVAPEFYEGSECYYQQPDGSSKKEKRIQTTAGDRYQTMRHMEVKRIDTQYKSLVIRCDASGAAEDKAKLFIEKHMADFNKMHNGAEVLRRVVLAAKREQLAELESKLADLKKQQAELEQQIKTSALSVGIQYGRIGEDQEVTACADCMVKIGAKNVYPSEADQCEFCQVRADAAQAAPEVRVK